MFGLEDLINDTIAGIEKNELETVIQNLLDKLKRETSNKNLVERNNCGYLNCKNLLG